MSWKKVKIKELCFLQKGTTGIQKAIQGKYPLVVTGAERKSHNTFQFNDEAVIIPLVSSTGHGHKSLKRIHFQTGKFALGSILCALISKNKQILNTEFLYRYLDLNKEIELVSRMRGMANVTLPIKEIGEIEISLPPLHEQLSIVNKIKEVENLVRIFAEEAAIQISYLENYRQQILENAIQGKLTLRESSDEHASQLIKRIKAEKEKLVQNGEIKHEKKLLDINISEIPFNIPKNWIWVRLGDVCSKIGSGSTPKGSNYSTSGIPFFRSQNIYEEGLFYRDIKFISNQVHQKMKGTSIYPGDLLLNITGGSLGRCAIVPKDLVEGNVSQHVCILRPLSINNEFLHKVILSSLIQKQIFNSTTGSGREGLPKYNLEQFLLPLPPLNEQKRILARINDLTRICDELERNIEQNKRYVKQLYQANFRESLQQERSTENQLISLPTLQKSEKQSYSKRKALAVYIINQSLGDAKFGDVKFQKLLHLTDYHILKRNLSQAYFIQAAGPYDNMFTRSFFTQIEKDKWFIRKKQDKQYTFQAGQNHSKAISASNYFTETELNQVNQLIAFFKKDNYERPEIISTLYAVWNNRLLKQEPVTDNLLKQDFLAWDPQKSKYKNRLDNALAWMRKENIVPQGWGKVIEKSKKKQSAKKEK